MLIALAALTATGVRGQDSTTTTHRKTPAATNSHSAHTTYLKAGHRNGPAASHHAETSRTTRSRSASSRIHSVSAAERHSAGLAHRQSAEEVGWRAGLAIRGRRVRRQGSRTRATLREVRLRRTYAARSRFASDFDTRATATSYRPVEDGATDGTTRTLDDAAASVAANSGNENEASGSRYEGQAFADTRASAAASSPASAGPADDGPLPRQVVTSPATAGADRAVASAPLGSASADQDAEDEDSPPPTEAASVRSETETEEASLTIPHGLMPSPLRGSLESLERQNSRLDAEGLERIEDESDLAARIADGLLVPVPVSAALTVNSDLLPNHRYCRPWTARFLADLAREHDAVFHKPLEVSSAVRTVEYQRRLMRTNGNAAPAEGDIVSPHLTGAAVDIAKSGLSRQEMAWMRQRLLALQTEGKIDVEEEFRQACFHITVYKSYAPGYKSLPRHHAAPSAEDEAGAPQGM
jgi:hypothetical protein